VKIEIGKKYKIHPLTWIEKHCDNKRYEKFLFGELIYDFDDEKRINNNTKGRIITVVDSTAPGYVLTKELDEKIIPNRVLCSPLDIIKDINKKLEEL